MKITTWNINSVRLRLPSLKRLIDETGPDVICLQETKVVDALFPADDIAGFGYPHQAIHGMKGYNGVAILSKIPFTSAGSKDWCAKSDCRHVFAELETGIEIHDFYIPAGGDVADVSENEKFAHKLEFLAKTATWWKRKRDPAAKRIMVGDFNVAPLETDVWSHKQLLKVVSHTPEEVALLDKLKAAGPWIDAVREIIPPEERLYSWWSYRSPDWRKNNRGRRLDHIWISPALRPALTDADVFSDARDWEKASDHAPVSITLDL